MPIYTFKCKSCGLMQEVSCAIDRRDESRKCLRCAQSAVRVIDAGRGLVRNSSAPLPPAPEERFATEAAEKTPNVTMRNVTIENCGGGVKMDGGYAVVDGMRIVDTPTGFELSPPDSWGVGDSVLYGCRVLIGE